MKRYVVQCRLTAQFDSLEYARNHARLNGGGTIWSGADCSAIDPHQPGAITLRRGAKPVEIVN